MVSLELGMVIQNPGQNFVLWNIKCPILMGLIKSISGRLLIIDSKNLLRFLGSPIHKQILIFLQFVVQSKFFNLIKVYFVIECALRKIKIGSLGVIVILVCWSSAILIMCIIINNFEIDNLIRLIILILDFMLWWLVETLFNHFFGIYTLKTS